MESFETQSINCQLLLPAPSEQTILELGIEQLLDDPDARAEMRKTFSGFMLLYFAHYITLAPSEHHADLIQHVEDHTIKFFAATGHRGLAKTSIGSIMASIFFACEQPDLYPFIIIVSDTRSQVVDLISDIRKEFEENQLLIRDYGDQSKGLTKQKDWTKTSLLLSCGVRIMGLSRGQRIRGRKHRQHRPSVVMVDDPETMEKVDKKEYRDKTEKWMRGEVIPAIEESQGRLLVYGNILHTDAIMMRLKNDPLFLHRDYSLFKDGTDNWESCTWKAKYPDQTAIDRQKQKVRYTAWMREYRLKVVPPDGQEVKEEWIQYYDEIPERYVQRDIKTGRVMLELNPIIKAGVGNDLAISKKQTADFTTLVPGVLAEKVMVEGNTARLDGMSCIYILPNPVNERLSLHETLGRMKQVRDSMSALFGVPTFYMEDVAYQRAAIEEAQRNGLVAVPMRTTTDKRSNIRSAAIFIQNGTVKFPRKGCENLIAQLTGFMIEDNDDLADGFTKLVLGLRSGGFDRPDVIVLND